MIGTVLRIGWLSLVRDRVALAMSFLLPAAFFSVFQVVFGSQGGRGELRPLRVVVVDEDASASSRALVAALEEEKALRLVADARPRHAPSNLCVPACGWGWAPARLPSILSSWSVSVSGLVLISSLCRHRKRHSLTQNVAASP